MLNWLRKLLASEQLHIFDSSHTNEVTFEEEK